ncbi:MAG TPA: RpiB/LacA/LacB family sugar-phosphate isomerase, partial [Thermotogaceae bacterium]|nr:RpiB/LacA/LacB family sugar-phosphate isomerase [Thermotogaceae bacterium]
MANKRISMASDHAGYHLKEELKEYLIESDYEIIDRGTFSAESVDYPDYAVKTCQDVINESVDFGILICGTGLGMSITANKIKGIR